MRTHLSPLHLYWFYILDLTTLGPFVSMKCNWLNLPMKDSTVYTIAHSIFVTFCLQNLYILHMFPVRRLSAILFVECQLSYQLVFGGYRYITQVLQKRAWLGLEEVHGAIQSIGWFYSGRYSCHQGPSAGYQVCTHAFIIINTIETAQRFDNCLLIHTSSRHVEDSEDVYQLFHPSFLFFHRENPHRPFRCLDCQYRRELVRVYLTNVEGICRRFVEEKREKLGKLMEDTPRWTR